MGNQFRGVLMNVAGSGAAGSARAKGGARRYPTRVLPTRPPRFKPRPSNGPTFYRILRCSSYKADPSGGLPAHDTESRDGVVDAGQGMCGHGVVTEVS